MASKAWQAKERSDDALQDDHAAAGQRENNLPKHVQEIYKEAFNSAEEQYGQAGRAHRVAWGAVENKYEKNDKGNWVSKES